MSKMKSFEDFNIENVNENLQDIPSEESGMLIYGDGEELELNLHEVEDIKQWVIENQMEYNEITVMDSEGDSIIITKEDTTEDIDMLFSDMVSNEYEEEYSGEYEEGCGCSCDEHEEGCYKYVEKEEHVKDFPTNELAPKFIIDEEEDVVNEYEQVLNRKLNIIKKRVDEINELIYKAIDIDGDKLEVIDPTSTWEEPMIYEPLTFEDNILTISYIEPWSRKKEVKTDTYDFNEFLADTEENYWILDDAKQDLSLVKRMYNKAIKTADKEGNLAKEETSNETSNETGYTRDMIANELGIDSNEFDDSADLGMMADRIGESKVVNFDNFLKNKKK
jgi:hypothetical protein